MKPAYPLSRYRGTRYYRFHVQVSQEWLDRDLHRIEHKVEVIAPRPADAVNLVRDELAPHVDRPTTFRTWGPKGGETERFVGWESMVWAKMCRERPNLKQLRLL